MARTLTALTLSAAFIVSGAASAQDATTQGSTPLLDSVRGLVNSLGKPATNAPAAGGAGSSGVPANPLQQAADLLRMLQDPTRPPADLLEKPKASTTGAGEPTPAPAPLPQWRLQSVIIGPGRRTALLNGETVRVGSKLGDARVTRIERDAIELRIGRERRRIPLFPALHPEATAAAVVRR